MACEGVKANRYPWPRATYLTSGFAWPSLRSNATGREANFVCTRPKLDAVTFFGCDTVDLLRRFPGEATSNATAIAAIPTMTQKAQIRLLTGDEFDTRSLLG